MKNLLYLAILTTAVVASWIAFNIYNNYATSTINNVTASEIAPIPPKFDEETILQLKSRTTVPADLNQTRAVVNLPAGLSPTPTQSATGGATITPTPKATSSAQIKL